MPKTDGSVSDVSLAITSGAYLGGDWIHAEGIGVAMKASGIGETNCFADQARKDPSRCFLPFRIQGEVCSSDLWLARGRGLTV